MIFFRGLQPSTGPRGGGAKPRPGRLLAKIGTKVPEICQNNKHLTSFSAWYHRFLRVPFPKTLRYLNFL